MDSSPEKPVPASNERLHADLGRLEWARDLSEETLTAIASVAQRVEFRAGEVVIEFDSEITHAYFVVTGRGQRDSERYFCPRGCLWVISPQFA
jgi:hypothetical protein